MKNKYWISWYHKQEFSGFELHSPWWITGYNFEGDATICAAVKATDEIKAMEIVRNSYDVPPGIGSLSNIPVSFYAIEWRFCEERPLDWSPFSDRFPKAEWMEQCWEA